MILLTGATGFLGMTVLGRLLEEEREVIAVVRAGDQAHADARVDEALVALYGCVPETRELVRAVPGDLLSEGLGLSSRDTELVVGRTDAVVHCAASVAFTLPLPEAMEINDRGTSHVLDLARRLNDLRRVVHVSTAYVAGERPGVFHEHDLELGQSFRNTYEQSKHAAERRVLAATDLPIVTVRPSIVVGESTSGWTSAFNVLYWPLRVFARGLMDRVPAAPDGIVDGVPVDYVAEGILGALDAARKPDDAVALVAGDRATSVDQLLTSACACFGRDRPAYGDTREIEQLRPFLPYFSVRTRFDNARGRGLIGEAPSLVEMMPALLDFAVAARWGKAMLSRAAARERAAALAV